MPIPSRSPSRSTHSFSACTTTPAFSASSPPAHAPMPPSSACGAAGKPEEPPMSSVPHRASLAMRLKLATLRTGFALGGRLAPRRTVERAARLFATPFASSRARARAAEADPSMRQERLVVEGVSIATYVWGDPATQPYVLLVHGWSSFGLRFRPWVQRLRALGL